MDIHKFSKSITTLEQFCDDYQSNIACTIDSLTTNLTETYLQYYIQIEQLIVEIEFRTQFLNTNPQFCTKIATQQPATVAKSSFDHLKTTISENTSRLLTKIGEFEDSHEIFRRTIAPLAKSEPKLEAIIDRVRPSSNLHSKLIGQIETNDSLESFKILMRQHHAHRNKTEPSSENKHQLAQKYQGSLYFFGRGRKNTSGISVRSEPIAKGKIPSKHAVQPTQKHSAHQPIKQQSLSKIQIKSIKERKTNKSRANFYKLQMSEKNQLKCYDILDDLDLKTLSPLQSEYPRRDRVKPKTDGQPNLLSTLVKRNDEKLWTKLLNPTITATGSSRSGRAKRRFNRTEVNNLMAYLTSPVQHIQPPKTLICMMVRVAYDNFPEKETISTIMPPKPAFDLRTLADNVFAPKKDTQQHLRRKKIMLEHLKGLQMRNDSIQKNIKKAIDVIETKMVDLLSNETKNPDTEAFTAMEKEITSVLAMMGDDNESDEKRMQPEKDENSMYRRGFVKKSIAAPSVHGFADPVRIAKLRETAKKTVKKADIEEGEKLLGQVDNVIKKIDHIYSRINENVPKLTKFDENIKKIASAVYKKVDFNDQPETEPKNDEKIKKVVAKVQMVSKKSELLRIEPEKKKSAELKPKLEVKITKLKMPDENPKMPDENPKVPDENPKMPDPEDDVPIVTEEKPIMTEDKANMADLMPKIVSEAVSRVISLKQLASDIFYPTYTNISELFQEATSYPVVTHMKEAIYTPAELDVETFNETVNVNDDCVFHIEERHEAILTSFYTFFFSSIFIAFNLNYAC